MTDTKELETEQREAEPREVTLEKPRRMVNEKQVLEIVPVSPSTLARMEKNGLFPQGHYISPNRKIWFEDDVVTWQNAVEGRGRGGRQRPARKKTCS
jgi:predicted DNA-binding transcriptional regulator AlpA